MRGQWLGLHLLSFFPDSFLICVDVQYLLFSAMFRASWYSSSFVHAQRPRPRVHRETGVLRVLLSVKAGLSHTIGAHQLD